MSATQAGAAASTGASPSFLLFLVFLVLKLTGVIAWSWVWITAPLWIGLAFVIGLLFLGAILGGLTALVITVGKAVTRK